MLHGRHGRRLGEVRSDQGPPAPEALRLAEADRVRLDRLPADQQQEGPRPFLAALAKTDGDVVARFVGGLRAADQEWAERLGLGDRLEVLPYVPRRRALELQRDSEALLLLLPEAGERGAGVPSGKSLRS